MQQLKEALSSEMQDFLTESKWESNVKEAVSELLEYKPEKPLVHMFEKFAIKSKLDSSNKIHAFINELSFFAVKMDPLVFSANQCVSKLLALIVEKHQQSKVKRSILIYFLKIESDALKICFIILQEIPNNKEIKDHFFKKVMSIYEDTLAVGRLAELIFKCILTYRSLSELFLIQELLDMKGQALSNQNLALFLSEAPQTESINKKIETQIVLQKHPQEPKMNLLIFMKSLVEFILAKSLD